MFYRRKTILALLQMFGGELNKIRMQKLLFLFTQCQEKKEYDFVPYKFGCYSFSANADLVAMIQKGILSDTDKKFMLNNKDDYLNMLELADKAYLQKIKELCENMNNKDLMRYTYINYPYWAINSEAGNILSQKEYKKVNSFKPKINDTILFTIGYEGISLEEYLNRLIKNDIKMLIDVRNNPLSMKFGFSKNQLSNYCNRLGIEYIHIPSLGIKSEQRQELNEQKDYDKLFANYYKDTLAKTKQEQEKIFDLLVKYNRIALTCFEANINQCHRKHLANAISSLPNFTYELRHI